MRVSKPPERRRAELINAARVLFDKNGVDNTRISDIVQYVGVAQGVFYYYFSSKTEIVDIVAQQVAQEIQENISIILANNTISFYQKLANYVALYLHVIDQFLGDEEESIPLFNDSFYQQNPFAKQSQHLLAESWITLIEEGVTLGIITIEYPLQTASSLLLGLQAYCAIRLPTRIMVYTIVEQTFALPKHSLTQFLPNIEKGEKK